MKLVTHDPCNGTGTCARCGGEGRALVELHDFPFGTEEAQCEPCRGTGTCPCTGCGGLERAQKAVELARAEMKRCERFALCGYYDAVGGRRCKGCLALAEIIKALGGKVE